MKSRPQWEGSQSQIGGLLGECPVLTPALLGADVNMLCGMLRAVSYTSVLLGDSCKPSFLLVLTQVRAQAWKQDSAREVRAPSPLFEEV